MNSNVRKASTPPKMSEYLVHLCVYKGRMTVTYMANGRLAKE